VLTHVRSINIIGRKNDTCSLKESIVMFHSHADHLQFKSVFVRFLLYTILH